MIFKFLLNLHSKCRVSEPEDTEAILALPIPDAKIRTRE
jgi:hypothetical protein